MEIELTKLQQVKERLTEQMTSAIAEAIKNGAKVEKFCSGANVDGVFIVRSGKTMNAVVLYIKAPEVEMLFEPSEQDMRERAEELRAELKEIENKLNSK